MNLASCLKRIGKRFPRSTYPFLKAFWHGWNETINTLRNMRLPVRATRVEFTALEIAELRRHFQRGPSKGEVAVESLFTAVSPGTEGAVFKSLPNAVRAFPYPPGYSGVGVVKKSGRGTSIKPGELVAGQLGHSSLTNVPEAELIRYEQSADHVYMSFVELGCIVQQGIRKAHVRLGDHVAILGTGLLGQLSVSYAHLLGAGKITLVGRSTRRKVSSSEHLPEHDYLVVGEDGTVETKADLVIECVGTPEAVIQAIGLSRDGGTVINLGSPRNSISLLAITNLIASKSVKLKGAHISTLPKSTVNFDDLSKIDERKVFRHLISDGLLSMPEIETVPTNANVNVNMAYERLNRGTIPTTVVFEW